MVAKAYKKLAIAKDKIELFCFIRWYTCRTLLYHLNFRYNYTCVCPNGFGGFNCHLPGCGGTYLTETTPREISVSDQTDLDRGCIWTFESPTDTRGALRIKSISYSYCYDFYVTIWEGNSYWLTVVIPYCHLYNTPKLFQGAIKTIL